MKASPALTKVREICLSLPDTKETPTWGQPHFRVGEKIFAGCGEEDRRIVIGFKLTLTHQLEVLKDDRFWKAPYVGHKGWVSLDASRVDDWDYVRALILESYRLIAPKRTLAKLEAEGGAVRAPAKKKAVAKKVAAKKKASAKTSSR
jgi:predicted DNA-binding protein (MmcQ/YjbR family)